MLASVVVDLLASRRTGMRLVVTQTDLAEEVAVRRAAVTSLDAAAADLTARQASWTRC